MPSRSKTAIFSVQWWIFPIDECKFLEAFHLMDISVAFSHDFQKKQKNKNPVTSANIWTIWPKTKSFLVMLESHFICNLRNICSCEFFVEKATCLGTNVLCMTLNFPGFEARNIRKISLPTFLWENLYGWNSWNKRNFTRKITRFLYNLDRAFYWQKIVRNLQTDRVGTESERVFSLQLSTTFEISNVFFLDMKSPNSGQEIPRFEQGSTHDTHKVLQKSPFSESNKWPLWLASPQHVFGWSISRTTKSPKFTESYSCSVQTQTVCLRKRPHVDMWQNAHTLHLALISSCSWFPPPQKNKNISLPLYCTYPALISLATIVDWLWKTWKDLFYSTRSLPQTCS